MRVGAILLLLGACDGNMVQQPRADPYEASALLPDGMVMQSPPPGTIDQGTPARAQAAERPPMSLALLERGRERFNIYCAVCHAYDGSGNGVVPGQGFPHPPSFHEPRLRAVPAAHFYEVITQGYGIMYSYADRVSPPDRWAIAAYIRALQVSQARRQVTEGGDAD